MNKPKRTEHNSDLLAQLLLQRIYPEGLAGRTVLDCACNCGGYSFWAKEFGASECFGFDVRQHWIDQARFLAENRTEPSEGIRFEVCDLYDLPKLELEPFDVTLFKGIFYHLPDPVTGHKIAADLTNTPVSPNSETGWDFPIHDLFTGALERRAMPHRREEGFVSSLLDSKTFLRILSNIEPTLQPVAGNFSDVDPERVMRKCPNLVSALLYRVAK